MKKKNHFKTAIKAKKGFNKKLKKFLLGKNETKLTCFNFVVGKGLTLVTLVGKTLFENYVEMVAGLPINEQNK